ncbi:MAG TPA: PASTA domain-containing protein [Gaiellaceae bacterium]|nr:PASTA domain-containing protein [Gaiellaceae bacterium]
MRHLVRILAIVVVTGAATGGVTWSASAGDAPQTSSPAVAPGETGPLVVPNVRSMPFVFAKETLEDAGFAWRVVGRVHGYPANTVVTQHPAPGTRLVLDGSPKIVLTLKRTRGYPQVGEPEDVSPYWGARAVPAGRRG